MKSYPSDRKEINYKISRVYPDIIQDKCILLRLLVGKNTIYFLLSRFTKYRTRLNYYSERVAHKQQNNKKNPLLIYKHFN